MAAIRSLALSTTEPISNVQSNGAAMRSDAALRPHSRGVMIASTTSSVAMPIVATVSTRRGALRKRRTSATSTTAPSTSEPTRPMPSPSQYDQPQNTMRPTARATGAEPRSAWAKLMTRLAR